MMTRTAARVLVDCLCAQGTDTIFGVPGESYLAVLDALLDAPSPIRMVPNRQEGGAAFMAAAWGKLTGKPGVCFVTRGPGATNAAIGVHAAMQDSVPMILFVGQVATRMRGREAFQELDYRATFGGLAKWATEIEQADRVPEIVARAFAVAQSGRAGPVVVALPEDMLSTMTGAQAGPRVRIPCPAAAPEVLDEIRHLLAGAQRPLVLLSGGRWSDAGRAALRRFAEANSLPVLAAFRCQDMLDNDSPAYVGDAGLGKTAPVLSLMREADVILALGLRFGEIVCDGYTLLDVPAPVQTLIHVHRSAEELNKVYTAALPVQADPEQVVRALAGTSLARRGRWAERTRAAREAWHANLDAPPQPGALDLGAIVRHLQSVLPPDAILTNGAGNFSIWTNRHFRYTREQRLLGPQAGAMGYGLPAAIAAKIRHPERMVVCVAGDGDFQMTMQELGCAMQINARPIVLVVNNGIYGTIRMHQEREYPGRVSFTDLVNPDFTAIGRAYGMHAERVAETAAFAAAFARAMASPTGALLDLMVDPESLTPGRSLSAIRAAALKGD
jgi:acetolactate synthase I/II/III large subunit